MRFVQTFPHLAADCFACKHKQQLLCLQARNDTSARHFGPSACHSGIPALFQSWIFLITTPITYGLVVLPSTSRNRETRVASTRAKVGSYSPVSFMSFVIENPALLNGVTYINRTIRTYKILCCLYWKTSPRTFGQTNCISGKISPKSSAQSS